jgi:phosphatidylglycerol:prolipoprotein diacylglycerol transferase
MLQTLFYIPEQILGVPVFGFGWALLLWAVASAAILFSLVRKQGWNADTWGYVPLLLVLGAAVYWLVPWLAEPGRGLPVRSFGVMMMLGVVAGVSLSVYRARRMGVDPEVIFSLAFGMFLCGILGARLFYVIEYPGKFKRDSFLEMAQAVLAIHEGGIVLYGAFFGGIAAAVVFFVMRKLPALAIVDIIAPGMVVGGALGRVGCFLNGCCFGGLCEADFPSVQFPRESPPYQQQLEQGWLHGFRLQYESGRTYVVDVFPDSPAAEAGVQAGDELISLNIDGSARIRTQDGSERRVTFTPPERSRPVHPVQLYDAANLALLALVLWLHYPLRRHDGETLALLLAVYPITRFVVEIIRVDEPGQFGTTLSISQWISLGVFIAGVVLVAVIEWRHRPPALPWREPAAT